MCAELFCDSADKAVDLFKGADNIVIIGEVTVFLFATAVSCKGHY